MDQPKSWVTKAPNVCGGDACIRTTRHTVHGLVEWKKMGLTDSRILEHHPDLDGHCQDAHDRPHGPVQHVREDHPIDHAPPPLEPRPRPRASRSTPRVQRLRASSTRTCPDQSVD